MSKSTTPREWPPPKIYDVRDPPFPAFSPPASDYKQLPPEVSLVIDNGSWHTRAGWSHETSPRMDIPCLYSKWRDRRAQRTYTLVGNDVHVDAMARMNAKSPFDVNLVANFDLLEGVFDYALNKLGVEGGGKVEHPVVLTEPVSVPEHTRKFLSELMFECYGAPSVAYGIDSLFSYYANNGKDGLVVATGHTCTHVIPVLNGQSLSSMTRRLNWGGGQSTEYLLRLMQLKYPMFPAKLSTAQAELMTHDHCYVSTDYKEEISTMLEPDTLEGKDRIVQFSYAEAVANMKTEEELAALQEKRKESGRRLQQQAAQRRLEKLMQDEETLEYYQELERASHDLSKKEMAYRLESAGFADVAALERAIKELGKTIRRRRKQDIGEEEDAGPPSFPLLEIPDEQLDEDGKKQKRQQKLLKANRDARLRAKAEKELEETRRAEEARRDEEFREKDIETWLREKHAERNALLTRLRDRRRLKQELNNRKSHAAQMRMKSIANLASEASTTKKRRRALGEDTFGANDEDWAVYRDINMNASDSEEEEEVQSNIRQIEEQLVNYDPGFDPATTMDAKTDWRNSVMHAFRRGVRPFDADDHPQQHQLHLNVERIRVPEVFFQPSMAWTDQAGVVEIASDMLLRRLDTISREKIWQDIFLTGGPSAFQSFDDRLYHELRALLPAGAPLKVRRAQDPHLDAWKGAAKWCRDGKDEAVRISRKEWEEMGGEYIKEHHLGNVSA